MQRIAKTKPLKHQKDDAAAESSDAGSNDGHCPQEESHRYTGENPEDEDDLEDCDVLTPEVQFTLSDCLAILSCTQEIHRAKQPGRHKEACSLGIATGAVGTLVA